MTEILVELSPVLALLLIVVPIIVYSIVAVMDDGEIQDAWPPQLNSSDK
jgi:hypothetical protein